MSTPSPAAEMIVWHNGGLVPLADARVSPLDAGFTSGAGVFETLVAYEGEPFAFALHHERLLGSARAYGLAVPAADELLAACRAVLAANQPCARARVRVTVTGGETPMGTGLLGGRPTVLVAAAPAPAITGPARMALVPWTRNERGALAGVKSTSYGENLIALAEARRRGADEALFLNNHGHVSEGAVSNIWFAAGGRLHTPGLDSGCLAGVTRHLVLQCCAALGREVEQSPQPLDALLAADEVFLTSSLREVQAVAAIDGRQWPEAPGPITASLQRAFAGLRSSKQ